MAVIGGDEQLQRRINENIKLVDGNLNRSKAEEEGRPRSYPTVVIHEDLWKPQFVSGCKIEIENCEFESVPMGDFVVVRIDRNVRIVRMLGWKYVDGKVNIEFLPAPGVNKPTISGDLNLLGRVYRVTNPATGKTFDPNVRGDFDQIYSTISSFGTKNIFSGLFSMITSFCSDWLHRPKTKKAGEESFVKGLKKITRWDRELKDKREKEKLQNKNKKRLRSIGLGQDIIEYQSDNDALEEEAIEQKKTQVITEASVDDWWIGNAGKR